MKHRLFSLRWRLLPVVRRDFRRSLGAPLLSSRFSEVELPNSTIQPGFDGMCGTADAVTTSTIGPYTVELSANNTQTGVSANRGFINKIAGRIDDTDASIRDFYRGYYYNRSPVNGEGISLRLSGLTPNQPYTLTCGKFYPDASANVAAITIIDWSPAAGSDTTGTSAAINLIRTPVPTSVFDPALQRRPAGQHFDGRTRRLWDGQSRLSRSSRSRFKRVQAERWDERRSLGRLGRRSCCRQRADRFCRSGRRPWARRFPYRSRWRLHGDSRGGGAIPCRSRLLQYADERARMPTFSPRPRHAFYRDYFGTNSTIAGDGLKLTIDGVTPEQEYDLKIWSHDPATAATEIRWSPTDDPTGNSGDVTMVRTPVPSDVDDPSKYVLLRVKASDASLDVFGGFLSGRGARINGFELTAVPAIAGDFNNDGAVNGDDLAIWKEHVGATVDAAAGMETPTATRTSMARISWCGNVT